MKKTNSTNTNQIVRYEQDTTLGSRHVRVFHCRREIDAKAQDLALLPGVQSVVSHGRYSVSIQKAATWSWTEVEAKLLKALADSDLRIIAGAL